MRFFANVSLFALPAWLALATAGQAGTVFEPVEPVGLSSDRVKNVVAFQQSIGATQLAAMEAAGYGAYGAIAVPLATSGQPVFSAMLDNRETAEETALKECAAQYGGDCTIIGVILPDS